jgi:hypothetical protein
MRRNIVRYAMLSYVITLQKVSFRVKKRFPTWQHMVDAGEYTPPLVSSISGNTLYPIYAYPFVPVRIATGCVHRP